MALPRTINEIADRYSTTPKQVKKELVKLGAPVVSFLGHDCVYEEDIRKAHERIAKSTDRADRVGHVQRILEELRRMGCIIEPLKTDSARQVDCYQVKHREGGGKSIGIKIQVVSHVHRGGGIHFNVGTGILRDSKVDWVVMVAPPFAPDTDYLIEKKHLVRQAKARGYLGKKKADDKPSFPKRITARNNRDPWVKTDLAAMLQYLGVGTKAIQRADEDFDAQADEENLGSTDSTK